MDNKSRFDNLARRKVIDISVAHSEMATLIGTCHMSNDVRVLDQLGTTEIFGVDNVETDTEWPSNNSLEAPGRN